MSAAHPNIGPELRKLAQSILDGIDPALRSAAALASAGAEGTGKCQQVWCPVCALAALVTGEQHPLLTVVAEHSVVLLEAVRTLISEVNPSTTPPPDDTSGGGATNGAADDATAKTRYQPIPVILDE